MKNKFIIVFSLFCLLAACSVPKSDSSLKNSVTELKVQHGKDKKVVKLLNFYSVLMTAF